MQPSTLYKVFYPAREVAGRKDLRWHDLRHTGAVLAAQTGATLAELMGRLGHTTPAPRCATSTPPPTATPRSPGGSPLWRSVPNGQKPSHKCYTWIGLCPAIQEES